MTPSARPVRVPVAGFAVAVVAALALTLAGCSSGASSGSTASGSTASGSTASAGTPAGQPGQGWVTAWGASQVVGAVIQGLNCPSAAGLANQTVRNVVFLSAGGNEVRIRLSNAFGARAITISHATVAQAASPSGGAAVPGSVRDLTFGGQQKVTLAPGTDALSDPARLPVTALTDLLVSAYVPGATGPVTNHPFAAQGNYLATGDRTDATSGASFTQMQCWMLVSGVEVPAGTRYAGTVVAFGDSLTDGYELNGRADDNQRWPDGLARRLAALSGRTLSVVNAGLVGNRLRGPVPGFPQYGIAAVDRLNRDVFDQAGVRVVILLEGVNDIASRETADQAPGTTADQVIAADKRIIAAAHAHGLRIFGATLTPFGGAAFDLPAFEEARAAVNQWIMTSHSFDGVIDFAHAVTARNSNPPALVPAFDSGDHTHPSEAGYQAMASAIDLQALLAA